MKSAPSSLRLPEVEHGLCARLPALHGEVDFETWLGHDAGLEQLLILKEEFAIAHGVRVRGHSECLTGDLLGSLRCDCGRQRQLARLRIEQAGQGPVLYMRGHEGRGIRLRAYALRDYGLDTVDVNPALGHPVNARRYEGAAAILKLPGVRSIRLMSNNPLKLLVLRELGIDVLTQATHAARVPPQNAVCLRTKRGRLGHLLGQRNDESPVRKNGSAGMRLESPLL
jgi:GTP cyclohydrolase II